MKGDDIEDIPRIGKAINYLKDWPHTDGTNIKLCPAIEKIMLKPNDATDEQIIDIMSIVCRTEDAIKTNFSIFRLHDDLENMAARLYPKAVNTLGPAKCTKLESIGACGDCAYRHTVQSPLLIKDRTPIMTMFTGFRETKMTSKGLEVKSRPAYRELIQYFADLHEYICDEESGVVFIYNGTHWEECPVNKIKSFAEKHIDHKPTASETTEFHSIFQRTNLQSREWFSSTTDGLINLKNGVFDIRSNQLREHSKDFGFRYCLPYDYDPNAKCPRFESFLLDITSQQKDLVNVIVEFLGYAISGDKCKAEKAMIMYGGGSNGKSTLIDTLKAVAGRDNFSSLSLTSLNSDQKRYQCEGKLFNVGEETNVRALGDSEVFKTMVTGGDIDIKKLWVQPYSVPNMCKLIMACNALPKSSDRSYGLYRRMLLVPFVAEFKGKKKNASMREELLTELPGIFNLLLEGYKRLRLNHYRFSESETLDNALNNYKIENDNVLMWVHERAELIPMELNGVHQGKIYEDSWTEKSKLYESYTRFVTHIGSYRVSKMQFMKTIKELMGSNYDETRIRHNHIRLRVIRGIILVQE